MPWYFYTAMLGFGLFVLGLFIQDPNWGSADFGVKAMFDGGLLVVISAIVWLV